MNPKSVVTILLLVFVAVSVGFLISKESRISAVPANQTSVPANEAGTQSAGNEDSDKTISGTNAASTGVDKKPSRKDGQESGEKIAADDRNTPDSKVVVYYFHGSTRCVTCRAIENFSRAAVGNAFPDEIQKGRLEFQAINVEEPANEHFVDDYQLVTRSVVL
jgi:hypothetical protein